MIAELKGAGEEANIRAVFRKSAKLSTAISIPIIAGLFWFGEDLLKVWISDEYVASTSTQRILLAAMMISVIHSTATNVLSMTGHQRFTAFSITGGQLLNLFLTIVLVRPFGIRGMALATLISTVVVEFGIIQPRACRLFGLTLPEFYRIAVLSSIPGCALMLGGFWAAQWVLPPTSLLNIAALEAVGVILFSTGFIAFGLDNRERNYYFDRIRRLIKRSGK